MTYKVIGLMSGSSLDGLDIACVHLTEQRGSWSYELKYTGCVPYPTHWQEQLKAAPAATLQQFVPMHTAYGKYLGACVQAFREQHGLEYGVDFVASHGHTVFHNPGISATFQMGDGAAIAAATGLSVITDLRSLDVAHGGQGAPIVPVGDKLLFPEYDYWLNLGGIANVTVKTASGYSAFDICPCNQVLNRLAAREGLEYDAEGRLAASGAVDVDLSDRLNAQDYFQKPAPKSLSNEDALMLGSMVLEKQAASAATLLHTYCRHIAQQVAAALPAHGAGRMLATGGGALNTFLTDRIREAVGAQGVEVVVPSADIIRYKEAIVMALIGALRWREEVNVLASVTGAARDSIGGAIWYGA